MWTFAKKTSNTKVKNFQVEQLFCFQLALPKWSLKSAMHCSFILSFIFQLKNSLVWVKQFWARRGNLISRIMSNNHFSKYYALISTFKTNLDVFYSHNCDTNFWGKYSSFFMKLQVVKGKLGNLDLHFAQNK